MACDNGVRAALNGLILLAATATGASAAGHEVRLFAMPHTVYCATDDVAPRWRCNAVAVNECPGPVTLQRVDLLITIPSGRFTYTESGDGITTVLQGSRRVPPGGVLVLSLTDVAAGHGRPTAVEINLAFTGDDDAPVSASCTVPLVPRRTLYLRFPLVGRWVAFNARTEQHGVGVGFAFDFVAVPDMPLHLTPPQHRPVLTDFASWSQPLLAPAAGTVADCRDSQLDFLPTPGTASFAGRVPEDRGMLVGNYLVLRTRRDEYVLLGHLRQGSLRVARGDVVHSGQVVGQVGNSGNTSGPHLHIEVFDGLPDFARLTKPSFAQSGLPFGFSGVAVERGDEVLPRGRLVPLRLDILRHASS